MICAPLNGGDVPILPVQSGVVSTQVAVFANKCVDSKAPSDENGALLRRGSRAVKGIRL